jgi:hypothetical protein
MLNTKTSVYLYNLLTPQSTRRLAQLPSSAPSMPDLALGTGRDDDLSTSALPPDGVLSDSSPLAAVVSVLLLPTQRPEGRRHRQERVKRIRMGHCVAFQLSTGPEAVSNRCGRDRPSRSLVNLFGPSSPALGSPFDGRRPPSALAHRHQQYTGAAG